MPWTDSEMDPEFRQWIMDFPIQQTPAIHRMLKEYQEKVDIIVFHSREEADWFIESLNY
jgi:hypothetical protein